VALSGNVAIVGAPADEQRAGSATVFTRAGNTWDEQQRLIGGEEAGNSPFGFSVALSEETALVGGCCETSRFEDNVGGGSAWAFADSGGKWTQQGPKLRPVNEDGEASFGSSVAVSGNTAVIGGPSDGNFTGAAWIYERLGSEWVEREKLAEAGTQVEFGKSVAVEGPTVLVGSAGAFWAWPGSSPAAVPSSASITSSTLAIGNEQMAGGAPAAELRQVSSVAPKLSLVRARRAITRRGGHIRTCRQTAALKLICKVVIEKRTRVAIATLEKGRVSVTTR
jgi:FG-GAP repeat